MPEKPIIIFPSPVNIGRYKLPSMQPKSLISPERAQQKQRIQSIFDVLEKTLRESRSLMRSAVTGIEPEMILVFETRGLIADFFKAVKRIPELEWLGELEKDFDADNFFHYEDTSKQVRGKLFFILTNYNSLKKILRLWRNYKYGRIFEHGTAKWKDLFALLYDIRLWGIQDRILETGILKDISYRLQNNEELVTFEVELWFRNNSTARAVSVNKIKELVELFEGEIVSESIIQDIAFHGLLIKAPIQIFNNFSEETDIALFKAQEVMFFRPTGQCAVKLPENIEIEESVQQNQQTQLSDPLVGLLDGLPLQNHVLLANRLNIDDPDNYSQNYLAESRVHGTSMASLIIYGELNGANIPIRSQLYVRPVMKSQSSFRGNVELIPEDVLVVDLMHRAVRRIFEADGDIPATAPTIKIINISIGDPYRVLDNSMSSWGKLLDWLSFKYKVLFIVSAGNFTEDIVYPNINGPFTAFLANNNELRRESVKSIYDNNRFRKIISPAESINALTVGASDFDTTNYQSINGRTFLFGGASFVSPISRMGLGYRRSVKPEVLVPGGRALYREKIGQTALTLISHMQQPGIKVAVPSPDGRLNGQVYSIGTSNSTAILTHTATKLHENLVDSGFNNEITNNIFPIVAKSLLVHCASWDQTVRNEIISSVALGNTNQRDLVTRFLGYGSIAPNRILDCTDKRVTMLGYGSLKKDQAHLFKFPIPVEISGSTLWRSVIVTLAWLSPVNSVNQTYRQSKLWFDFPDKALEKILSVSRKFYDHDTVNRGTVQHEIFDGVNASAFLDGTVLPIRVNCKEDAYGLGNQEVSYAISVTLEVDPAFQVDIYEAILTRIREVVPV